MGQIAYECVKQMRTYGRWSIFSLERHSLGQLMNENVTTGLEGGVVFSSIILRGLLTEPKTIKNKQINSTYGMLRFFTEALSFYCQKQAIWIKEREGGKKYAEYMIHYFKKKSSASTVHTAAGGKNITYIKCIWSYSIKRYKLSQSECFCWHCYPNGLPKIFNSQIKCSQNPWEPQSK